MNWKRPDPEGVGDDQLRRAHDRATRAVRDGVVPVRDFRANPGAQRFIERVLSIEERDTTDIDFGSILTGGFAKIAATLVGGGLMKVFQRLVQFFPEPLRDYVPTVVAAAVILVNAALSAAGLGVDAMTFIEIAAPSGLLGQIMTARQRLWDRGGSSPGQVTSKTKLFAGAGLATIAATIAVTAFFPVYAPLALKAGTFLLGLLGLSAGAALTAGAKKTPAKKPG